MSARSDLLATLLNPAALQINFTLDGITIRGTDYVYIADILRGLVRGKRLSVLIQPAIFTQFGAGAEYRSLTNTFVFPENHTTGYVAIHEATHAILDVRRAPRDRLFNETVAYVATAIYERRLAGWGTFPRLMTHFHPQISSELYEAAEVLAESIIVHGSNFPPSELQNLHDVISRRPLYRHDLNREVINDG